eukprot:8700170-Pyramimonas_sp.AAC.1
MVLVSVLVAIASDTVDWTTGESEWGNEMFPQLSFCSWVRWYWFLYYALVLVILLRGWCWLVYSPLLPLLLGDCGVPSGVWQWAEM